jgi:hypothetical protein
MDFLKYSLQKFLTSFRKGLMQDINMHACMDKNTCVREFVYCDVDIVLTSFKANTVCQTARFVDFFSIYSFGIVPLFVNITSVDTELYCPKGKCGCQYFILTMSTSQCTNGCITTTSTKRRIVWARAGRHEDPRRWYVKQLKVRSCVFISNFHHSYPPPPPPKGYTIVSIIIN